MKCLCKNSANLVQILTSHITQCAMHMHFIAMHCIELQKYRSTKQVQCIDNSANLVPMLTSRTARGSDLPASILFITWQSIIINHHCYHHNFCHHHHHHHHPPPCIDRHHHCRSNCQHYHYIYCHNLCHLRIWSSTSINIINSRWLFYRQDIDTFLIKSIMASSYLIPLAWLSHLKKIMK